MCNDHTFYSVCSPTEQTCKKQKLNSFSPVNDLPFTGLRGFQEKPGRHFQISKKNSLIAKFKLNRETWRPLKKYCFKPPTSPSFAPALQRPAFQKEDHLPRWRGQHSVLGWFLQKLYTEGTGGLKKHSHPLSPAEVRPGYLLSKNESDCHLVFLLFVDYQTPLSCFQLGRRKDGGREEIPASVATG